MKQASDRYPMAPRRAFAYLVLFNWAVGMGLLAASLAGLPINGVVPGLGIAIVNGAALARIALR